MADDGKVKIAIDVKINPYGECKKSVPPAWFANRTKLLNLVSDIQVKRTMTLDGRKWKKKDIENGIYAVARYDLALFATVLTTVQKDIDKAIPPKIQKKKFNGKPKDETKDEAAALSTAEKKISALWNKVSKNIKDKVSLALDEVESDKGDNKKAIAAGKEAIKIFDRIDVDELFKVPINDVMSALKALETRIKGASEDEKEDAFKFTLKDMREIETEYEFTAKSTSKVAKMFLALGEKMAKDKNSDKELQNFGQSIAKGNVKSSLEALTKNISAVSKDLDALVNFLAKGEGDAKAIAQKASKFKGEHEKKKGTAAAATASMRKLSEAFKKIEKKLK